MRHCQYDSLHKQKQDRDELNDGLGLEGFGELQRQRIIPTNHSSQCITTPLIKTVRQLQLTVSLQDVKRV
jgi:hypothetical protein